MANIPNLSTITKQLEERSEVAWQEIKTQLYIESLLGHPYWKKETALIYKLGTGPAVFFRSELDALGTSTGPKHVCGHSSHVAALVMAYLTLMEKPLNKTIYFLFQPSEESYPSGAKFIAESFPELLTCKAGFAFHVHPSKILGEIVDVAMAGADYFEIIIKTQATHIKNKYTDNNHDALRIAARLITLLNGHTDPHVIINIGTCTGGSVPNAIAGEVKLTGDIRARNDEAFEIGRKFLKETVAKEPDAVLSLFPGYPPLVNDPAVVAKVKNILPVKEKEVTFGTEDFSFYPIPKAFFHIGTGEKTELHNPHFSVPEKLTEIIFNHWLTLADEFTP